MVVIFIAGKEITMYAFKLQPVLDHRQFIEDNLKKELAEFKQQVLLTRQKLDSMKRKEMATLSALKQDQQKGISSDQVLAYHAYLKQLWEHIARQQAAVEEMEQQESEKQATLIAAMKRRQVLEKLKQQGLDRYNQAILKKETDFIDEIAVNQFVRETMDNHGDSK